MRMDVKGCVINYHLQPRITKNSDLTGLLSLVKRVTALFSQKASCLPTVRITNLLRMHDNFMKEHLLLHIMKLL